MAERCIPLSDAEADRLYVFAEEAEVRLADPQHREGARFLRMVAQRPAVVSVAARLDALAEWCEERARPDWLEDELWDAGTEAKNCVQEAYETVAARIREEGEHGAV